MNINEIILAAILILKSKIVIRNLLMCVKREKEVGIPL